MRIFEPAAGLIALFYGLVHNYAVAIGLIAVVVMLLITPLTLKSTKGMLEMQRLQPEMRRLQSEFKGDRTKLNEAMMKLYKEHKVNPLSSCLPIAAQMPVFIIMFRALSGLVKRGSDGTFSPQYLNSNSDMYHALNGQKEMLSFGLDLAKSPINAVRDNFGTGLIYIFLVVILAGLYFVQQRMVASRTVSPTMSAGQAKLMQYLPVAFAIFQIFLTTQLVVYYMVQALVRIVQQYYITRRFYGHDQSIGRQAQAASAQARDMAKDDKDQNSKKSQEKNSSKPGNSPQPFVSKRVTPPKGKPTPSAQRPQPPGKNRSGQINRRPKPPKN
ncbi:MAG: YidC/Oxa1 family membrane protein insertase [Ilumatobacteraceae bacterium]